MSLRRILPACLPALCAWGLAFGQNAAAPPPPVPVDAVANVEPEPPPPVPRPAASPDGGAGYGLGPDIKAYFTAPLRWDGGQWAWFGGALVAIGAAHHYDTQVRTHFVKQLGPGQRFNSDDVQDAIPTAAVLLATWGYAVLTDDRSGHEEAWTMLEAAGLGSVTAYALKYAVGRQSPDDTDNPNRWFRGGSPSFPSWHSTAAFAVGTVLAESGNDDYRWIRRLLGYGLGAATSYERLKHNAHWLSDTVAGAALGIATARFSMDRREGREAGVSGLTVEPVPGGAILAYRLTLP